MTEPRRARGDARRWITWFGVLVLAAAGMLVIRARLDKAQVALVFLLVVLWGSSAGGRALGVSLASGAFLVFNWFFLPPYNTLIIANPLDWLVLIVFLVTGVTAAQLLERMRQQARLAEQRAEEIDRIATLGSESLNAPRAEDALDAIAAVIGSAMRVETCLIYLRTDGDGALRLAGSSSRERTLNADTGLLTYAIDHAEIAAERADGSVMPMGDVVHARNGDRPSREPVAALRALGIPLNVRERVVGALRISSATPFSLSEDQRRVLGALSYYAALGAERVRLAEAEGQTEALRRADRLKDSLLAAVSHDLRTPLTAIKGIANEVWRGGDPERAYTIEQEADRLTAMVDDLLELSQLNAGKRVDVALNTIDDVVGAALERVEAAHGVGRIHVEIVSDGEILVGAFDFAHTMRALTNLLENALKYSPAGSSVRLKAWRERDEVHFAVSDEGPGVPMQDREHIFEPFYRGNARPDGVRGTGLGLAIARQLAEAQGGVLVYEASEGQGSRFVLTVKAAAAGPPD